MSRTVTQVRDALAAQITAIGGSWNQATVPYALHGPSQVPDAIPSSKAHLSFSVGCPETTIVAGRADRQRPSLGTWVATRAILRFLARITPKTGLASEAAGQAAELAVIQALLAQGASYPGDMEVVFQGATRSIVPTGEWAIHEVAFVVYHRLALQ
jgi:hypothetical protein